MKLDAIQSKSALVKDAATDTLVKVTIGDWVCFKSDVEQAGQIIDINGKRLVLGNENGFEGGYIGGETRTTIQTSDAWVE